MIGRILPPLTIVIAIIALWTISVIPMNAHLTADQAQRDGMAISPEAPRDRQKLSGLSVAQES